VAYAGILQQSATLPRKFAIAIVVSLDAAVLTLMALLGPIAGTLAVVAPAVMLYGAFSPIGFVLTLALTSHVTVVGTGNEIVLYVLRASLVVFMALLTFVRWMIARSDVDLGAGTIGKYFFAFMLWGGFCTLFAVEPLDSLKELLRLSLFFPVYILARETIRTRFHVALVVSSFGIAIVANVAMAFFQIEQNGFMRVMGFYGNPNFLGMFLMFSLPTMGIAWYIFSRAWARVAIVLALTLGTLLLLLTWSRDSIISVAIATLAFLILERKKKLLMAISVGLVAVTVAFLFSPSVQQFVLTATRAKAGTTSRTILWNIGMQAFARSPIVGLGYNIPKSEVSDQIMWNDVQTYAVLTMNTSSFGPHNVFISQLMSTGIPGLVLFLLFYRAVFSDQFRSWKQRQSSKECHLHIIIIATLVGTLFHAFFEYNSFLGHISWASYFWITLGMVEAIKRKNLLADETASVPRIA
jgi:O-antigen ligase